MPLLESAAGRKRAKNMIWSAAGTYDFSPEVLAFQQVGSPDPYMNCVIGLVQGCFDPAELARLFALCRNGGGAETAEGVLWLGLENYVYSRTVPERPVLSEMREQYAQEFLALDHDKDMVRWAKWSTLLHNLQTARWNGVLGLPDTLPSKKEEELSERLALSGTLSPEEALKELETICRAVKPAENSTGQKLGRLGNRGLAALRKLISRKEASRDGTLHLPGETAAADAGRNVRKASKAKKQRENAEWYMEHCFGRPVLSAGERRALDGLLCTGNHEGCHLWITRGEALAGRQAAGGSAPPNMGVGCSDPQLTRDALRLSAAAQVQTEKNAAYFQENRNVIESQVRSLTARLQGVLKPRRQHLPLPGSAGRLDSRRVWRAACLPDPRIFSRDAEDPEADFCVTLLLDGSESRNVHNELLAVQGYIAAESLRRAGVPVQVLSFCSVKNYTVLQILKDFDRTAPGREVLRYFAVGMNRDGLALRGAAHLLEQENSPGHILLTLTDALPMDNTPIPGGHPLKTEWYEGNPAVKDTAQEVRALRNRGIRVGAVFMGRDGCAANAAVMFGKDLVRIRSIEEFAGAAGQLLEHAIRQ